MLFELLGFFSGIVAIGSALILVMRHERWKAIREVYAGRPSRPGSGGNALIWPSH